MKVLVTGGCGFIGPNLVKALLAEGNDIVVFDISENTSRINDVLDRVKFVHGDVSYINEILRVVREHDIDTVFHLAALLTVDAEADPWRALKVNVDGTANVLEASRICNVKKIVFPSTRAVFGPGGSKPLKEDDPKNPNSIYGITKLLCEEYGLKYFNSYGLDFRSVRLVMVYGAGRTTGGSSFGAQLIEYPALGKPVKIEYGPEELTDWLYVKDAVRALLLISDAKNLKRRIYNIKGETHSLGEVANIVKKMFPGSNIEFSPGKTKLNQIYPLLDDGEARRDIGWAHQFSIEQGIKNHVLALTKGSV